MKAIRVVSFVLIVASLSACATSGTGEEAVAETHESGQKRVCTYERTTSAGSRMERVCRWVDTGDN